MKSKIVRCFRRQQNNPSNLLLSVYLYISATRSLFFMIKRKLTVGGIQRALWFKIRAIRSLTLASSQGCSPTCPSMKSASWLFEIYDQLALWRKGRVRNSTQHHSSRYCCLNETSTKITQPHHAVPNTQRRSWKKKGILGEVSTELYFLAAQNRSIGHTSSLRLWFTAKALAKFWRLIGLSK